LAIVLLAQILTLDEALKGFSNESLVTIGALYFVVGAVQKSHVMDYLARQAFGIKSSNIIGSARMLFSLAALSGFFNNTPLCHLMIPIVRDWARARGIPLSYLLIPLSYTVIGGGLCTMIGTSTSLTVQALIQADIGFSFPFFAPALAGVPATIILIIYMLVAAPYLLPSRSGLIRELRDRADMFVAEVQVLEGSVFVGLDLGAFVGRLGILQDGIIKIRRKVTDGEDNSVNDDSSASPVGSVEDIADDTTGIELSTSARKYAAVPSAPALSSITDASYVKKSADSWGRSAHRAVASLDDIGIHGLKKSGDDDSWLECEEGRSRSRSCEIGNHTEKKTFHFNTDLEKAEPDLQAYLGRGDSICGGNGPEYRDVINPSRSEIIRCGDIIFVASAGIFSILSFGCFSVVLSLLQFLFYI
jgi:hypothetical protein